MTDNTIRDWNSPDAINWLGKSIAALREHGKWEPELFGVTAPLDFRGLEFPTRSQCKKAGLSSEMTRQIAGRQSFADLSFRNVDFAAARLDFCAWDNCSLDELTFDKTSMNCSRLHGCRLSNCTFRSVALRDAVFTPNSSGLETQIAATSFEKTDFSGTTFTNIVLRSTSFENCKFADLVFDGAECERVSFSGKYKSLTFRGVPNDTKRNRLWIDLSQAELMWLNADMGIDLQHVVLPSDKSCIILKDRRIAIPTICARLNHAPGSPAFRVSKMLENIFSDRAQFPLDQAQDTFLLSKKMIAYGLHLDDIAVADAIFEEIYSIAKLGRFLVGR